MLIDEALKKTVARQMATNHDDYMTTKSGGMTRTQATDQY